MQYGSAYSVQYGSNENLLVTMEPHDLGSGVLVRAQAAPGCGQYFKICCDGINGPVKYVSDTAPLTEIRGNWDSSRTNHIVSLVPQGEWSLDTFDATYQARLFQQSRSDVIHLDIPFDPELIVTGDGGAITNLALSGLVRFQNCLPVNGRMTWAKVDLVISSVGSVHTVELQINGLAACSGSRTGDGSLVLEEANDSGVSGSLTYSHRGDVTDGVVYARWPAAVSIYYRHDRPWISGDFPTTYTAQLLDDGHSNLRPYSSPRLAPGDWYVVVHAVSDTGVESTSASNETITLVLVPEPPEDVAYVSGDSTPTISWTASTDAAATYNIYDSTDTGILDTDNVTTTHASGTGTLTKTLGAITGTYSGTRFVLVRSLLGGIESGNSDVLSLSYTDGIVQVPVPNDPGLSPNNSTAAGRTLTVRWNYAVDEEAVHPEFIELFAWPVGSDPDYDCPIGRSELGESRLGMILGTVSGAPCYDGLYMYGIKAISSGGVQSLNVDSYGPVVLSEVAQADPSATVSGGI